MPRRLFIVLSHLSSKKFQVACSLLPPFYPLPPCDITGRGVGDQSKVIQQTLWLSGDLNSALLHELLKQSLAGLHTWIDHSFYAQSNLQSVAFLRFLSSESDSSISDLIGGLFYFTFCLSGLPCLLI